MSPRTVLLALAAALTVGYLLVHQPLTTERDALQREHARLSEQARIDRELALLLIDELEREREALEAHAPQLEAALPSVFHTSAALGFLRERATSAGLALNSLRLESPTRTFDLSEIAVHINLESRYEPLTTFVHAIENGAGHPLRVRSLTIRPNEEDRDPSLSVDLTVVLSAFDPQPPDPYDLDDPWMY